MSRRYPGPFYVMMRKLRDIFLSLWFCSSNVSLSLNKLLIIYTMWTFRTCPAPFWDCWQSWKAHFGLAVRLLDYSTIYANTPRRMTFFFNKGLLGMYWSDNKKEASDFEPGPFIPPPFYGSCLCASHRIRSRVPSPKRVCSTADLVLFLASINFGRFKSTSYYFWLTASLFVKWK